MNISQSRFTERDIPYHEFEKLGFSKMDLFTKMNRNNLERLMSGKRTSVFEIRGIDSKGQDFSLMAKFSFLKKEDGTTTLNLHPVRPEIKNDIGLTDKEIKKLQNGELVSKSIENERYLVQLDKETNELLKVKTKNIIIPSHIRDAELNNAQKEQLRKGQIIAIESGKEKIQVGIDLDNQLGLKFSDKNFEQKQLEAYDRQNPHVIGIVQTDRNRHEFLEYNEKQEQKPSYENNIKASPFPDDDGMSLKGGVKAKNKL
jgi:hypothetical protein